MLQRSTLRIVCALALVALAACTTEVAARGGRGGSGGGGGGGSTDTGSSDTSILDADGSADTTDPVDGSGDTTDPADTSDGSSEDTTVDDTTADTTADTSADTSADTTADTTADTIPPECITGLDCDDANPCTLDRCTSGVCSNPASDIALTDPVDGDCRRSACSTGTVVVLTDNTDTLDDGIACTVERCSAGTSSSAADDGLCGAGEICDPTSGCVFSGGECIAPPPAPARTEVCDSIDNDRDGSVDEGCGCTFGATQPCYAGGSERRGIGSCIDGVQVCTNRLAPQWGTCNRTVSNTTELCDGRDNDCNGCADDGLSCPTTPLCPDVDTASLIDLYQPSLAFAALGTLTAGNWTVTSPFGAATAVAGLTGTTVLRAPGRYTISGAVTYSDGRSGTCNYPLDVFPGAGLNVFLAWSSMGSSDMDLHLHRAAATNTGAFCLDASDCHYANCRPPSTFGSLGANWGYSDTPAVDCEAANAADGFTACTNPRLVTDNLTATDPEWIIHDSPRAGETYRVMVHQYDTTPPAGNTVKVEIWCGGQRLALYGEPPDTVPMTTPGASACLGQSWRVADVTVTSNVGGVVSCTVAPLSSVTTGSWDFRTSSSY